MLVPITRNTLEELVPPTATGAQYIYFWDGLQTCVKRIIGSLAGVFVVWPISIPLHSGGLSLFLGITVGLYWLWAPIAKASWRNRRNRRYPYAGFWQGKILDVYVTEEVVGTEETANQYGELTIVENRERRLNLEIGDRTGFETSLQVPLQKQHKLLGVGISVQMLVLSETPDLSSIAEISDLYVPSRNLWVSDYPMVRRDAFVSVGRQIAGGGAARRSPRDRGMAEYDDYDRRKPVYDDYAADRAADYAPDGTTDYAPMGDRDRAAEADPYRRPSRPSRRSADRGRPSSRRPGRRPNRPRR